MTDVIGIPWCREENYETLRSLFIDSNNLPATWAEFAKATQDAECHYQEVGAIIERVEIDLHAFPEWCASHTDRIDSRAHFRFADAMAKQRQRHTSKGRPGKDVS